MTLLLDTGPVVALLDSSEAEHAAMRDLFAGMEKNQLLTTAAIVTEAFYFLEEVPNGPERLVAFLAASDTQVHDAFTNDALERSVLLMRKYADTPMDFAGATLVWLAEKTQTDLILTLDRRGFSTFRFGRNRRFRLLQDEP